MTDKAFSVTQFVDIVNLSFEQFESVAVEGEISTSTKASSGHWYFSIKDEEAVLSCAMFRETLLRARCLQGWRQSSSHRKTESLSRKREINIYLFED